MRVKIYEKNGSYYWKSGMVKGSTPHKKLDKCLAEAVKVLGVNKNLNLEVFLPLPKLPEK